MARLDVCPDEQKFQSAMQGLAAPGDMAKFAAHIETCQSCSDRFERSLAGDTLIEAMQGQATVVDVPNDSDIVPLVEQLIQLRPDPAKSDSAAPDATQCMSTAEAALVRPDDCGFLEPAQAPDEIGRLGTYRILKVLGSGGMGMVFQAEDIHLKRKVALKVMKPQVAALPTAKERFLREAQAAAQVEHENIVIIHQVGEVSGVAFLAMQWLKGESLDDVLKTDGPMPTERLLKIGRQIALGLDAAHGHGLIHRDIKPANIWIESAEGKGLRAKGEVKATSDRDHLAPSLSPQPSALSEFRVKILDFGLARALADDTNLTQSGSILGTPAYMAPEQARGEKVDPRSDLFSLGVVLYRMATGELPFRGATTMAILTSLAIHTPAAPDAVSSAVPKKLSDLILQLLAKDPAHRPASGQEVADRLDRIGQHLASPDRADTEFIAPSLILPSQIQQPPNIVAANTSSAAPPPSRKFRWLIATAGLAALVVMALVFFMQTSEGIVRIEITDPNLLVELSDKEAVIKGNSEEIRLKPGSKGLQIKHGGLEFETVKFELKKGETVRLKVDLLGDKVLISKDGKNFDSSDRHPPIAASSKSPIEPKVAAAKPGEPVHPANVHSLDKLDPKAIPESERFPWQPKELVAVMGEHRGRHWGDAAVYWDRAGNFVATVGANSVTLWDPKTLRERAVLSKLHDVIAAFSLDGKTVAVGSYRYDIRKYTIGLWDIERNEFKERLAIDSENAQCLAMSQDGKSLVAAYQDHRIRRWDISGAQPVEQSVLNVHKGCVRSIAFSPDGKMLASASEDLTIRIMDVSGKEPMESAVIQLGAFPYYLGFAPDGKTLVDIDQKQTRFWDLTEAEPQQKSFDGTGIEITPEVYPLLRGIEFSPDGMTVAKTTANGLQLFDLKGPKPRLRSLMKTSMFATFSPDGKFLISIAAGGLLRLWDLTQGEDPLELIPPDGALTPSSNYPLGMAMAPDGQTLAAIHSNDTSIHLWDLTGTSPKERAEIPGHLNYPPESVAFSPDAKRIVSGGFESTVRLWDTTAPEAGSLATVDLKHQGRSPQIRHVMFTPDGKSVLASEDSNDGMNTCLFSVDGDKFQQRAMWAKHGGPFAITSDGRQAVLGVQDPVYAGASGSMRLWDLGGPEPTSLGDNFGQIVYCTALSPNGKTLAIGVYIGVKLLDISVIPPKEMATMEAPDSPRISLSPDGRSLVVAGSNGELILTDVSRKQLRVLKRWQFPGAIFNVAFAPDGRHIATSNRNGTHYILRIGDILQPKRAE